MEVRDIIVKTGPNAGKEIKVSTPNSGSAWRVKTVFTKEPDTISWISAMKPGDTFLDVGANMGLYSLYAAFHGLKVYAFEPHAQNYALLVQNIQLNGLSEQIKAYCVALTDETSWGTLYMADCKAAGSLSNFGEKKNFRKEDSEFKDSQGAFGTTIDSLPWHFDHIKVDVDGIEDKVVRGARVKLKSATSILVECNQNLPEHLGLIEELKDCGFRTDEEQIKVARRTEGPFENVGNVIFMRDGMQWRLAA